MAKLEENTSNLKEDVRHLKDTVTKGFGKISHDIHEMDSNLEDPLIKEFDKITHDMHEMMAIPNIAVMHTQIPLGIELYSVYSRSFSIKHTLSDT